MMKAKTKTSMSIVAVVLTLSLFSSEQTTSALSARSNCRNAKGKLSEISNPNGTTGRITRGGILNGTTELVFTSGVLPTPDPTTVSYTDDFTIRTNKGILRTHDVGIFDFATGLFTAINRIDPNASTGRFAGATGVLFISGKTTDGGATFESRITGEMCLARGGFGDDEDNEDDNEP